MERYLLLTDLNEREKGQILFKIGKCYRLSGELTKAVRYFQSTVDKGKDDSIKDKSVFQIGYSYYLQNKYNQSRNYLREHLEKISTPQISIKSKQLIAINHLLEKEWEDAIRVCNLINQKPFSKTLKGLAIEGQTLPRKSKFLAGLLSSIIPGLGKVYTGYWKEGLISFVVIGSTGWRAYESFRKDRFDSLSFWLYGFISTSFYLGNIYGSAVSAQLYNEKKEDEMNQKIKVFISKKF